MTRLSLCVRIAVPLMCLYVTRAAAHEDPVLEQECHGIYKGVSVAAAELAAILKAHAVWVQDEPRREDDERRANLCGADLTRADFSNADLRGIRLVQAFLGGANFKGADLRNADLRAAFLGRADLQRANLTGTLLNNADLRGANLEGIVGLTPDQISSARIDTDTHLPAGLKAQKHRQ